MSPAMPTPPETKHTPGPWRAGRGDMLTLSDDPCAEYSKNVYATDPRGGTHEATGQALPWVVAKAYGDGQQEPHANARLIAAAPDLLEALDALLRAYESVLPGIKHISVPDYALVNDAPVAARRALLKATGAQP